MKPVLETVVRSSPAVWKPYARREQGAEDHAGERPFPAQRPDATSRGHRQHDSGDGEADGEKGEERVELERVLHLDERHAPHRRDRDQEEERDQAALRAIAASQRLRMSLEKGPTRRQ
jgi:hypothetical protein